MTPRFTAPAAVLLWLAAAALGLALAVRAATEPPVWDALSYVQKSFAFWQTVHAHQIVNPFDLPMTVRPPGTILMSYPFGWSPGFHWFYFRSLFAPIAFLAGAVYLAGWQRELSPRARWILAALALALAGMPILYQLQSNEELPLTSNWGLVDGFVAGVAAIAAAAAVRSVALRSVGWAAFAALAGGFTLWVKPAGLALMGLTGLVWLILLIGSGLTRATHRYAALSVLAALVIFAAAAGLAFNSAYFSPENIAFGQRALDVLEAEYVSHTTFAAAAGILRASLGFVVPLLVLLGVGIDRRRAPAFAALICIAVGLWFWLGQTDISQIRYFLPFLAMAFVVLVPTLLAWMQTLAPRASTAGAAVVSLPALAATLLLFTGAPTGLQRALGINLHVNDYAAENKQAQDLLDSLQVAGKKTATVYLAGTSAPLRNLQAVWDFAKVTRADEPQITALVPTDWQNLSTVRTEDLLRCDYIAVETARDAAAQQRTLAVHDIADFPGLIALFNAWIADLTPDDGVAPVSATRARLLRITDRPRFEAAIARLEQSYNLPPAYRDANPQRWWSGDEVMARAGATPADVTFHTDAEPTPVRTVRAVEAAPSKTGYQVAFWFESGPGDTLTGPWLLFGHLVDATGNILANAQIEILPGKGPTSDKPLRYYTLSYPIRPPGAVAVAFGFFQPKGDSLDFLAADQGTRDWDGKRVIWPLPSR